MTPLTFVFMGTPNFGIPALKALLGAGHRSLCIFSQPPRPAGRGQTVLKSPVHEFADQQSLRIRTPKSLKGADEADYLLSLSPDVVVVAAYGLMLPRNVLETPQFGCINIHASLLPRWRGAAPIQRAIMSGDNLTGITIMRMEEGLDTGPILSQQDIPIKSDNSGRLHDRLAKLGAEMILDALLKLKNGTIKARPQPESGSTYAARLTKADERLNWRQSADELGLQIRALSPAPKAHFVYKGERWKVLDADIDMEQTSGQPGRVLDNQLTISCSQGTIKPVKIQRPGRRPMTTEEVLRGAPIPVGTDLP